MVKIPYLCVPFLRRSLHFFCKRFFFLFLFFILSVLQYIPFHMVSKCKISFSLNNSVYHTVTATTQKIQVSNTTTVRTKKSVVKVKPDSEVTPVVKKVRRVLPEHEGNYKITMPSGTTPRSQKILAKQGLCK